MCIGKKQKNYNVNKTFLKNNSIPLSIYLLFLVAMCYIFLYKNRDDFHVQINQLVGNRFIDAFFFYITFLGDGTVAVFILLISFFINVRLGIYLTLSFLIASLLTIFLKHQFFEDHFRPYWIYQYQNPYQVKKVDGVDLMIYRSFPSGHATQAFAIFFACALVAIKKYYKFLFVVVALLASFSRVYLAQHWLKDITAGSIIGVFFAVLFYFIFYTKHYLPNLNKPLMQVIKR
jgi:membrane-associated phospholipid phosphatase